MADQKSNGENYLKKKRAVNQITGVGPVIGIMAAYHYS